MRRYVITGGFGLLGQRVARHLINSFPPPPPIAPAAAAGGGAAAATGGGGCLTAGGGVRVMIVDKGLLGTAAGGPSAVATATINTASSPADDNRSRSSRNSSGTINSSGAGRVEGSLQPIMAGCGTTASPGGGAPSSSSPSVVVVRGDLTSTDVAAEIKSFAAGAATCSPDRDGDKNVASSLLSIFHLASVMSGHAENDSDEALRVNVDGKKSKSAHSSSQVFSSRCLRMISLYRYQILARLLLLDYFTHTLSCTLA